jgi:hypothetical protein
MKVIGTGQINSTQQAKKAGKTGNSDFSRLLEAADEAEEAKPAVSIKSISSINIIQEVNPDGQKKRQLVDKGNEMLDKLEEIRDSLLFGNITLSRLQNLQKIIDSVETSNTDSTLADIIEEIKTRAAVELAKLGF